MPEETGTPVEFDRVGAMRVLEAVSQGLAGAARALEGLTGETIAATLILGGGVRPRPIPPPPLASDCHPSIVANWKELRASEAFATVVACVHALLVEVERAPERPRTLSELASS